MKILKLLIILLVFCIFAVFLELSGYAYHTHILSLKYKIHGIDISHHQEKINWNKVDKRYKFVLMKATEGQNFLDRDFLYNWNRARLSGFRVGAYHYFSMTSTGIEQANFYISKVPNIEDSFPPIIDLEVSIKNDKDKVLSQLKDMIVILEKYYKKRVIIYTTNSSYKYFIKGEFLDNPIWQRDTKYFPKHNRWEIWQYSNRGRVSGISGFTDRNAIKLNIDDFINKYKIGE